MNAYETLGVSMDATKDEIRKAYIALVKQNHPDRFTGPDEKRIATEKTVELNAAYALIMRKLKSSYTVGATASGDESSIYTGEYATELLTVREHLEKNSVTSAKYVLDSLPLRNGEWYYLYSLVYMRNGQYTLAREYAAKAHESNPANIEYERAYNTIKVIGPMQKAKPQSKSGKPTPCKGCIKRIFWPSACKSCKHKRYGV